MHRHLTISGGHPTDLDLARCLTRRGVAQTINVYDINTKHDAAEFLSVIDDNSHPFKDNLHLYFNSDMLFPDVPYLEACLELEESYTKLADFVFDENYFTENAYKISKLEYDFFNDPTQAPRALYIVPPPSLHVSMLTHANISLLVRKYLPDAIKKVQSKVLSPIIGPVCFFAALGLNSSLLADWQKFYLEYQQFGVLKPMFFRKLVDFVEDSVDSYYTELRHEQDRIMRRSVAQFELDLQQQTWVHSIQSQPYQQTTPF